MTAAVHRHWFLLLGALICAAPGLAALGKDAWTTEQGAHGPIILVTGLWLLWRESSTPSTEPSPRFQALLLALLFPLGAFAVYSAIIGKLWTQWSATYLALVCVYGSIQGLKGLQRAWFPIFYLGFLIPPPPGIIVPLTRTLKLTLADCAAQFLAGLGFNAGSLGATLYIDSYELVVAAACSGLNSLTSLLAVGLLYVYLRHHADPRHAAILGLLTLPVAILANFLRIVLLLLVTHYFGNEMAQGMLHDAAGLTTFSLALGTLVLLDLALSPLMPQHKLAASA